VPDPSRLALFCAAALVLLVVPGPAVLYVVTQSIAHGRRGGVAAVAGIHSGTMVHVVAATAGLSALLASSTLAFDAVKYAGAAYLVVVGVRRLAGREHEAAPREAPSRRSLYRQGIVVNVLNPKTALFFLAFLPQFVDPSHGAAWHQILVLGLVLGCLGFLTDGAYALAAGTLGEWLATSRGWLHAQRWVSGCVFVALGATAALTGSPRRA
jgi:threonine/homoserine/homoserine lactone efflux protein